LSLIIVVVSAVLVRLSPLEKPVRPGRAKENQLPGGQKSQPR